MEDSKLLPAVYSRISNPANDCSSTDCCRTTIGVEVTLLCSDAGPATDLPASARIHLEETPLLKSEALGMPLVLKLD